METLETFNLALEDLKKVWQERLTQDEFILKRDKLRESLASIVIFDLAKKFGHHAGEKFMMSISCTRKVRGGKHTFGKSWDMENRKYEQMYAGIIKKDFTSNQIIKSWSENEEKVLYKPSFPIGVEDLKFKMGDSFPFKPLDDIKEFYLVRPGTSMLSIPGYDPDRIAHWDMLDIISSCTPKESRKFIFDEDYSLNPEHAPAEIVFSIGNEAAMERFNLLKEIEVTEGLDW